MSQSLFKSFFEEYSKNVDHADRLYFWKLSDCIIEALLMKHLSSNLTAQSCILDVGGGTGRWIVKLAEKFPCAFALYDKSSAMLVQARIHLEKAGIADRVRIYEGDMCAMNAIPSESIDAVISIYNPLSFVDNPQKALRELSRIVKSGGIIAMMGQGLYNCLFSKINNFLASGDELLRIEQEKQAQWAPSVPNLHMFTKESLEELFTKASCIPLATYGIPVFAQPTAEDFDPNNIQRGRLSRKLEDDELFFKAVFDIEMKYNGLQSVANRGMNLMTIAKKI